MKLYEIPKGSKILLVIGGENREEKEELCTFDHADGMYSHITTESGSVVHLGASTDVEWTGTHYKMV